MTLNGADRDTAEGEERARRGDPGTGGGGVDFEGEAEAKAKEAASPWGAVYIPSSSVYTTPSPPREWFLRDTRGEKHGVYQRGDVGLLVAEGGAGKTTASVQLAVAVATGGVWLGTFTVSQGKALLIVAEEDDAEVNRRLRSASVNGDIVPNDGSIHVFALRGKDACIIDDKGEPTAAYRQLVKYLTEHGPFVFVSLDPLSRFGSEKTETDNAHGTKFIRLCEALKAPSGGANVLVSHHSNKASWGTGGDVNASSSRGGGALITGARFNPVLHVDALGVVTLKPGKRGNYSLPWEPVELTYGEGGSLVLLSSDTRAEHAKAKETEAVKKKTLPLAVKDAVKAVQGETRAKLIAPIALDVATRRPGLASKLFIATVRAGVPGAQESETRVVVAGLVSRGHLRTNGGPNGSTLYVVGDVPYVSPSEAVPHGRGVGVENVGEPTLPTNDKVNGVKVDGVVPYVSDP